MKNSLKKICCWFGVVAIAFVTTFSVITQNVNANKITTTTDGIVVVDKRSDTTPVITINDDTNSNSNSSNTINITIPEEEASKNNSGNTITITIPEEEASKNNSNPINNLPTYNTYTEDKGDGEVPEDIKCDNIADNGITDGKIGAMQWILCPTMDNTTYTATKLDKWTQDLLEIKTNIYSGDNVTNAWSDVRNVANVLMIIFLMIVVFSQLTGRGIDNYGIKKMLPRLITMAIIINLSLYICQIAVDLSNILGEGLRDMFGSFGGGTGGSAIVGGIGALFTAAGSAGSAAIGVVTTASALGLTVSAGIACIIVVILMVIIIAVAVLVLFAMLGARQVIILFCVVISPLAFAAFILPNTQGLFKKWWELFKTALIIFPICGAVAGISAMIKGITKGQSMGVPAIVITTLLPYLVFFLVPTLLKQAISAASKVGGALMSMGSSIRSTGRQIGKATSHGIQKSEWGKRNLEQAARRRQERWAENYTRRHGNGEDLSKRIEAAKLRVNHTDPNTSEGRRARKDLASLQRQALLANEAQQIQNRNTIEQEMADIGGVIPVDRDAIHARAVSNRESQEIKNYTDQYSGYTRAQMGSELSNAITAYNSDRSDANATRLQAAIATAESRGMNQEMLNYMGGLNLGANNANDAKVLSRLSSSSNKVVSQYGIQMSKPANVGQNMSMNSFAESTGPVKLSEAFTNKGPAILNNMDDDTLQYINERGTVAGSPVVSSAMLANAAASTTNQKELKQINDMFTKVDPNTINFSGKQLASFDDSTIQTLMSRIKPGSELQKNFITATNDIANSPDLMGTLRPEQRKMFGAVRRGANPTDTTFNT